MIAAHVHHLHSLSGGDVAGYVLLVIYLALLVLLTVKAVGGGPQ